MITEDTASAVRIASDQIVIGRGDTEIVLTFAIPAKDAKALKPVEVKMARTLAARVDV